MHAGDGLQQLEQNPERLAGQTHWLAIVIVIKPLLLSRLVFGLWLKWGLSADP